MNTTLSCRLQLPPNYRQHDVLAFHKRDALMLAERVSDNRLEKGILWNGHAACLTLHFQANHVTAELAVDGDCATDNDQLQQLLKRMLGLTQQVEEFEKSFQQHSQLGQLIANNPGLRVPVAATPFEALAWAIIGQQISVSAAISIRRKFIQAVGLQHSSGFWCHPDANAVSMQTEDIFWQAGFSKTKTQTLLALSNALICKQLVLNESIDAAGVEYLSTQLSQIRGIGPWTINYALLRGFGWLDGSLHGDVAVRRNLQKLLNSSEKITERQAQHWLTTFSPWRALVAAHLWAMPSTKSD